MGPSKAGAVLLHLHGAAYTSDRLVKFLAHKEDVCPFCGGADGIFHRPRCPNLRSVLDSSGLDADKLEQQTEAFRFFGIVDIHQSVWDLWCALGEITLTPSKPMLDTTQFLLFVDGTCTSLRNRLVRVAGAACTVEQGEWSHEFLKGSVVPGVHQNSGRAEILAGILAVSFAWTVEVRSDYLLFTQRAQELLQGNSVGAAWCNQDLWGCFQGLIAGRRDVIKICKVPAHKNWKTLHGRARFDAYHN